MSTKTHQRPRTMVDTGASAGIGRAAAIAFGARGDRVALLAADTPAWPVRRRKSWTRTDRR